MADAPSQPTADAAAVRIASFAPFWGPPPGSNRWHDFEYHTPEGDLIADGDAVRRAVNAGLLLAERHDEPGAVLPDPTGGEVECRWRYHRVEVAHG